MIGMRDSFGGEQSGNDRGVATAIDPVRLVASAFREGGWLQEKLDLEHRPQQEQMAGSVTRSLLDAAPLLFEAGTGVGKSLAYLIPLLVYAHQSKRQGVVSTHTIALQEQVQKKDLPLCRRLFQTIPELQPCADFRTAVLVGRGNYLCGYRLAQALSGRSELFDSPEQAELERIAAWAEHTGSGLRHELSPAPRPDVWDWVNADSSGCNNRNCNPKTCFYRRARAEIAGAHVVVVNHSLLFALIGAGAGVQGETPGILFPHDSVVIDEAHTVSGIATEYAGEHVSSYGLNRLLRMLYNPRTGKGVFHRHGRREDCQAAEECGDAAALFFEQLRDQFLRNKSVARIYQAQWAEPTLDPLLAGLAQRLGTCANRVEEEHHAVEIHDLRKRVGAYRSAIANCLEMSESNCVYWIEKSGRLQQITHLRSAPLDVAAFLRQTLFSRETSVVLTSATLAEGPEMGGFIQKVGAANATAIQVDSPFDYSRNMRVFVAADAPLPEQDSGALDLEFLADSVLFCSERFRGGSLVLFTSYADLHRVMAQIEETLQANGRPVYMQGRDGSRTELVRAFTESGNAILAGTDSFWAGIDVPGPSLSQVIITRLPFENPSHPIAEARAEWIRRTGGNPFYQLTLPDAVVKFRQGVGRLIRNHSDRGTVTLLDARVLKKTYGRRFLSVLPNRDYTRFTRNDRDWSFQPLESA